MFDICDHKPGEGFSVKRKRGSCFISASTSGPVGSGSAISVLKMIHQSKLI